METVLIVVHVFVALFLGVSILLQSGKGGGVGAGFGGTSSAGQQIFGGRGASGFLSRATVVLATLFMSTSLALAYTSSRPRSIMDISQKPEATVDSQVDEVVETGGAKSAPADAAPLAPAAPQGSAQPIEINLGDSPAAPQGSDQPIEINLGDSPAEGAAPEGAPAPSAP